MTSRLGNWAIAFGAILSFTGLCVLPGAFGKSPSPELLSFGACLFSMGAVTMAVGIYVKASVVKAANGAASIVQSPSFTRKNRGGCDLCGNDAPAVLCKTHELSLCGGCLSQHYDVRSCIFVPLSRKPVAKTVKVSAKARGA